jgi:hypothetical protein
MAKYVFFFSKVEVLFYEGKIKVNEEKLKKKSDMVRVFASHNCYKNLITEAYVNRKR